MVGALTDPVMEEKKRKSRIYSTLDGSFYSVMVGFSESFFQAFAIFLKSSALQLGLIVTVPQMLGSLFQLLSYKLLRLFGSRRRFVLFGASMQALMHIPIILVYFFGTFRVWHLILFISLYWIFCMLPGPAWNSWMGDLVNENERGRYFGRRNSIASFVAFSAMIVAGFLLQNFSSGNQAYLGFIVIFLIGMIGRFFSAYYLWRKWDPPYEISSPGFSLGDFLREAPKRNFGRLVILIALMNLSVCIAGPYFASYMLEDLHLSYWMFTLINATIIVFKFLFMPIWGKAVDRYGAKKVLTISCFLMPFVALPWIFARSPVELFFCQAFSGFVWAGFEISSFSFIFDATSSKNRPTAVAYFNVVNGVCLFVGAIIGAFLIKYVHISWSHIHIVFLVSSIMRLFVAIILTPALKEVRTVEQISDRGLLIQVLMVRPNQGIHNSIIAIPKKSIITLKKIPPLIKVNLFQRKKPPKKS